MKYYSVPADFKKTTIDRYSVLNDQYPGSRLYATYGNISVGNDIGSGRDLKKIPEIDFDKLADYVSYSKANDIDFYYTINASYVGNQEFTREGRVKIRRFLERLKEIGVEWLIISIPSLMETIQSFDLGFKIKASVICQIVNVNKAMFFKKMGIESIVIDESINREFALLEKIRKYYGEKVEVIVNSICHQDCHYRMFHYNQISGDSVDEVNDTSASYYTTKCVMRLYDDISSFFKLSWIRPEDLRRYTDVGIQYFKIQGRQSVIAGDPVRAVEAYFKEDFNGNLVELLTLFSGLGIKLEVDNKSIGQFLKQRGYCHHDCGNCKFCFKFAQQHIQFENQQKLASDEYEKLNGLVEKSFDIKRSSQ